jgi:protein TonB
VRRLAAALLIALLSAAALAQDEAPRIAGEDGVPVPKRTRFVAPSYPPDAQARGVRGIVILELTIDAQGRVAEVDIVRSIPGLDEAAADAARRWQYEPVKIDGRPVAVRLTVPITFLLRLPETTRADGVPDLRQGAAPQAPAAPPGGAAVRAEAELIVDGEGRVRQAEIVAGERPWSEALLTAVRTWAFMPEPRGRPFAVRVRADFAGGERGKVSLHIGELRLDVGLPVDERAEPAGEAPSIPEASPSPSPAPTEPAAAPQPAASPAMQAGPILPAPPPTPQQAAAPPQPSATPAPGPEASPSPPPAPPSRPPQPEAEVLRAPVPVPTPAPAGVSAIQGVVLGEGVPDLARGRRPVVPPIARMQAVTGAVTVRFAIDASGATSVAEVSGPEALKRAASDTVQSWSFRRTSIDRLRATADFVYGPSQASASVRLDPS